MGRSTYPRLLAVLSVLLLLASCGGDDSSDGTGPTEVGETGPTAVDGTGPTGPTDIGEYPDELIAACNALVLHMRAFDDVSNALIEPGATVNAATRQLEESQTQLAADADAFEEIGEPEVALLVRDLAEVIGALAETIESGGSIQAGIESELGNMQAAVIALGEVDRTCP